MLEVRQIQLEGVGDFRSGTSIYFNTLNVVEAQVIGPYEATVQQHLLLGSTKLVQRPGFFNVGY